MADFHRRVWTVWVFTDSLHIIWIAKSESCIDRKQEGLGTLMSTHKQAATLSHCWYMKDKEQSATDQVCVSLLSNSSTKRMWYQSETWTDTDCTHQHWSEILFCTSHSTFLLFLSFSFHWYYKPPIISSASIHSLSYPSIFPPLLSICPSFSLPNTHTHTHFAYDVWINHLGVVRCVCFIYLSLPVAPPAPSSENI